MTLTTYFKRPDALNASQLASKIGVSRARITQLKDKPWPPELALAAERETSGLIDAAKLSPVIAEARKTGAAA